MFYQVLRVQTLTVAGLFVPFLPVDNVCCLYFDTYTIINSNTIGLFKSSLVIYTNFQWS